jgi:hypothetical protein
MKSLQMRETGGQLHPALQAPTYQTCSVFDVEMEEEEENYTVQSHPPRFWPIQQQSPHRQNGYWNQNLHLLVSDSGHALTAALHPKGVCKKDSK